MSVYDHPDWLAFVAGIRADPGDDTARLVAADWLEERGAAARAELIRAQVKLFRAPAYSVRQGEIISIAGGVLGFALHDVPNPDVPPLRERIEALTGKRPRPDGTVHVEVGPGAVVTMARGFEERVRCPADQWLAMGDELLKRGPLTQVTLTDMAKWDARVAQFDSHDPDGSFGCKRWPGVRFKVHTGTDWAEGSTSPLEDLTSYIAGLRGEVMRGLGVPSAILHGATS